MTDLAEIRTPIDQRRTPRLAKTPVFLLSGTLVVLLLALAGRYGYFGDELYFLAAGRHLAWGYADQPPLVPLLARAMDAIVPGSPTALRIPSILATGAGVVLSAMIAREMGGARKAQLITAATFVACGQYLGGGHYLATSTIDPFLWTVLIWLVVRWLRTHQDSLLIWAGVVTALALYTKFLVGAFWLCALIALMVFGPRELMRRPALWIGGAIAVVAVIPTLIWQANNGWPQLSVASAISSDTAGDSGRLTLLSQGLLTAGIPVGAVLLVYGLWRLTRSAELRPYRFLGWAALGVIVIFFAVSGRYYYFAGLYSIAWAAAAIEIERGQASKWWRWVAGWPVLAVSFLITVPIVLPVLPQDVLLANQELPHPQYSFEEMGWPEMTASVAAAYNSLPVDQRAHTAIVTRLYWQAAALDHYGQALGLPEAASGQRGFWTIVTPPDTTDAVLYVGDPQDALRQNFAEVVQVGTTDTSLGVDSSNQGQPLWLATGPTAPWPVLWQNFKTLTL